MTSTITLAFLHHAAAFLVVGALMTELVVLRNDLTVAAARSVLRMDAVYGVAATALLVAGLLRVFHTEKGAAYYFASGSFLTKLTLFVIVGLLSVYPTMTFIGWRRALREQRTPDFDAGTRGLVHRLAKGKLESRARAEPLADEQRRPSCGADAEGKCRIATE